CGVLCAGCRDPARRSEGRVVVPALVASAGPRVGVGSALGRAVAALTALVAVSALAAEAASAAATAAALDLGGLRGRVAEGGAELVDVQLDAGAVVALAVGEGALLEAALCDHAGALLERRGHVLRGVAPDGAAEEQRLDVLPLVRLAVEGAGGGRDGERRDRDAGLRESQLGVRGEVADHRDDGAIRHGCSSAPGVWWIVRGSETAGHSASRRMSLVRMTDSLSPS